MIEVVFAVENSRSDSSREAMDDRCVRDRVGPSMCHARLGWAMVVCGGCGWNGVPDVCE